MRILRKFAKRTLRALNIDVYLLTNDRRVLEQTIMPWLTSLPKMSRVLFVGCDWYTRSYRHRFDASSYWTMDYDPKKKPYGSKLHITDSMANVRRHFQAGGLDLVICNGVFGWGLDGRNDVEAAFGGAFETLRPGGLLLLGWNDIPERKPFPLCEIRALKRFQPRSIEPLGESEFVTATDNRHTFNLYEKQGTTSPVLSGA
jgi:hypothetical protein